MGSFKANGCQKVRQGLGFSIQSVSKINMQHNHQDLWHRKAYSAIKVNYQYHFK